MLVLNTENRSFLVNTKLQNDMERVCPTRRCRGIHLELKEDVYIL